VTGREILKEIAGEAVTAELYARGYVCVPKEATREMLRGGYWSAPGEDLGHVWEELIAASELVTTVEEIRDRRD
jgi:hypothetical protein